VPHKFESWISKKDLLPIHRTPWIAYIPPFYYVIIHQQLLLLLSSSSVVGGGGSSINIHVPFTLPWIMMPSLLLGMGLSFFTF
jgi:hypothetical protein